MSYQGSLYNTHKICSKMSQKLRCKMFRPRRVSSVTKLFVTDETFAGRNILHLNYLLTATWCHCTISPLLSIQLQDMHAMNVPTPHCVQYTLPHPNSENILKAFSTSAVFTQQVAILHSSAAVKGALATVTGCTYIIYRGHLKGRHGSELKSASSCETLGLRHGTSPKVATSH